MPQDAPDHEPRPRRDRLVQLRVTAGEQAAWRLAARRLDLPVAQLVRWAMREFVAGDNEREVRAGRS